jgi:hypothetical protein
MTIAFFRQSDSLVARCPCARAVLLIGITAAVVRAAPVDAQSDLLATRPGLEVGGQVANYEYHEPGLQLKGNRAGVVGTYAFVNPENRLFTRAEARGSFGSLNYTGSGTLDSVPDWILEARILIGKDFFPSGSYSLSPYFGLGYRYLYNDLRGYSSTGAVGYRRYSNYLYAPVGFTSRIKMGTRWVLAPSVEYDAFISGKQESNLSDTGLGYNDVTNTQDDGYGYRVSIMVEDYRWTFGLWMHYWHIMESDRQPISPFALAYEPENWTRETGFELRYRF